MKILLVNSPLVAEKISRDMAGGLGFDATAETLLPPVDLAILGSSLRKANHKVKILDPEVEQLSMSQILTAITKWGPDVIIATLSLPSIIGDVSFIKKIRSQFEGKIFIKTSITDKDIIRKFLSDTKAEGCLWGEVDLEIPKIVSGKSSRGVALLKQKSIFFGERLLVDDLDKIPLPARDLIKNKLYRYPLLGKNCTIIQTSRGCPFPCFYYCPYPLVQGRQWRAMGPDRVLAELQDVVQKYRITNVLFRDATFSLDKKRTLDICKKIAGKKLKFRWWCETRVNCLDEELLAWMKKAGCVGINIGVETGDPDLMKVQGKPGVDMCQLKKIKNICDRVGIKLHFLLLIGLPKETRLTLYKTFKMIKELNPYSGGVTVVTPYPGTPLFAEAKKKGWIETENWAKYSGNLPTMHTGNLSSSEIKLAQKLIQAELFFLKKPFWGKLGIFLEDIFFCVWKLI